MLENVSSDIGRIEVEEWKRIKIVRTQETLNATASS